MKCITNYLYDFLKVNLPLGNSSYAKLTVTRSIFYRAESRLKTCLLSASSRHKIWFAVMF